MTSKVNERIIRYAKYATAGDVSTDPTPNSHLSQRTNSVRAQESKADDNSRSGDGGERRQRTQTGNTAGIDFSDAFRGLAANPGTTITPASQLSISELLEHCMGADVATATAAAAMTADGTGTPGSGTLDVDDATKTAPGLAVAFVDAAGGFAIREVVSESVNELTFDRAYDALPSAAATCFPALTYRLDPDGDQEFIYFDVEDGAGDWRTKLQGCQAVSLTFDIPASGEVTYSMSFQGNNFERAAAASPAYAAPNMGSGIRVVDSPLYLADTEYCFRGGSLAITLAVSEIPCTNGPNGRMGFAVQDRTAELSGSFYLGSGSNPKEVPATGAGVSLATFNTEGTYDLGLQLGLGVTKGMYVRMPAADFLGDHGEADGVDVVTFSAVATKSGNETNVPGGLRVHVV